MVENESQNGINDEHPLTPDKSGQMIELEQEKSTEAIWLERNTFRIALVSILTALSVVMGYMFAFIPNIEVFTMMIFLSGFILGKREGMLIGSMSGFIFCFFNPLGATALPLLSYQVLHYTLVGLIGALTANYMNKKAFFKPEDDLYVFRVLLILGILGAAITFVYDILSSVVDSFWLFGTLDAFVPYYLSGLFFTTVHLIGNILVFIFILPGLIQLMYKLLDLSKEQEHNR
ncbi:MAG: hypothetical protein ACTSR8_01985 [Promethearchaeota archaeon]